MRTRGWAMVQEAMGAEAAAKVSEAGSLARRHGHARVTPLHVASAILSSASSTQAAGGLLRLSGHPLRHEDLKVSFHDALSRLPAACPVVDAGPLDLSNALVALLKRAQTFQHQRSARGGRRSRRRRKVASAKIELDQLVASILDDPSVHRAMRKAASGSQVKRNVLVEQSNPARAGAATSSAGTVRGVLGRPVAANDTCNSWDHGTQARTREGLSTFVGQCRVTTERASLPSWFRRHQDAIHTCHNTSIQPTRRQQKFADLSATNFKIMCQALEQRVPQHRDIIAGIATTVLLCRSGMMRRARSSTSSTTWLLFQGKDYDGKKAMARELSKLVFGSYTEFLLVNSSDTGSLALKKKNSGDSVMGTLLEAILENPHRVVFIDGINQLDYESEIEIKNLIATGRIIGCNGSDMVNLEDAIVVLSSFEASSSGTVASFPLVNRGIINRQNRKMEKAVESRPFSLDLNACAEDVKEEEDNTVGNNAGIMSVVDGVFYFH